MTNKPKKITLNVPENLHRVVKATAAAYGVTITAVVNRLFRLWIQDPTIISDLHVAEPPSDITDRLQQVIDKASSDSSDE